MVTPWAGADVGGSGLRHGQLPQPRCRHRPRQAIGKATATGWPLTFVPVRRRPDQPRSDKLVRRGGLGPRADTVAGQAPPGVAPRGTQARPRRMRVRESRTFL
jgi:hypothetical protein